MARKLLIVIGGILAALLLLLIATVLLIGTPWGTRLVDTISRPIIADVMEEKLGWEITYAPIHGPLPGELIVQDIVLSQSGEVWFEADRVVLSWHPFQLIRREISVDDLVIVNAKLHALPQFLSNKQSDPPPRKERDGSQTLPDMILRTLVLRDVVIGEDVLGETYTLSVVGEARVRAPRLDLTLYAETAEQTDDLYITGTLERRAGDLDIAIRSTSNGAISKALRAEGDTEVRGQIYGEREDVRAQFSVVGGHYGDLTADLRGQAVGEQRLAGLIEYAPGSFLSDTMRTSLGDLVTLDAEAVRDRGTVSLSIANLSGAFGQVLGELTYADQDKGYATTDLSGELSADVLELYGAESLSGPFTLSGDLFAEGDGYAFEGQARSNGLTLSVVDGTSNDDNLFDGRLTLEADGYTYGQPQIDALLDEGAVVRAHAQFTASKRLTISEGFARLGKADDSDITLRTDATAWLDDERFQASLKAEASPSFVKTYLPEAELMAPLPVTIEAEGGFSDFLLELQSAIPKGTVNRRPLSAGMLRASFSGLPQAPAGRLSLTSESSAYSADAQLTVSDSSLTIDRLDADFGGLTAAASGSADLGFKTANFTASIDAGERLRLITGQTIGGRADVAFRIEEQGSTAFLDLTAKNLRYEDYEIGSLSLRASGPETAIDFNLEGANVTASPLFLTKLSGDGVLSLGNDKQLRLSTFSVSVPGEDDNTLSLAQPTRLRWGDAIVLDDTRFDWLGGGVVTASANVASDRWQGSFAGQQVPLPKADAVASFVVNLDTNDTDIASFQFVLMAEGEDDRYALRADGQWTGEDLSGDAQLLRNGQEPLGTITASYPLVLKRDPALSLEAPHDDVALSLRYDDRFEAIYAFMPTDTQPITGDVRANVDISGTLIKPKAKGRIDIANTRFEESEIGINLLNLDGGVTFSAAGNQITADVNIQGSGLEERQGSVKIIGAINLDETSSDVDLRLNLDKTQLARSAELELTTSADLSLTGTVSDMTFAGPISIRELDFAIPTTNGGEDVPTYRPVNIVRVDQTQTVSSSEEESERETPFVMNIDLDIGANDRIFVRGRGLESEWSANLTVKGTSDQPRVAGDLEVLKGRLQLGSRDFDLTTGEISFDGSDPPDPLLSIQAETVTGEIGNQITAVMSISGRASSPSVAFSSSPSLPEEDVLALILFGRPATQLGASEALELAQAAATLSGTGPFGGGAGLTGSLRSSLGLDRLAFDAEARSVTVGKYVADNVYVSAVQGVGELGTAFNIVYDISKFFSLNTTIKQTGAQEFGANYRRDY